MEFPAWFGPFLAEDADRPAILLEALASAGIQAREVPLAGSRHIVATPRHQRRDPSRRLKVITAHHDRVPGTPGALDNSAAVLQLVAFLQSAREAENTYAIFTDREELGRGDVRLQGSWALGKALSGLGIEAPAVFCLDVTGRGDTLILSTAADTLSAREPHLAPLAGRVGALADGLERRLGRILPVRRLGVPFGEDLGFLCSGQAALVLTVLPAAEASAMAGPRGLPSWASPRRPEAPATWSRLHSSRDTADQFDHASFALMGKALASIADWVLPAWKPMD